MRRLFPVGERGPALRAIACAAARTLGPPLLLAVASCAAVRVEAPAVDDPASPRAAESPPPPPPRAVAEARAREAAERPAWTCSMHPDVRCDAPGTCPICGMTLVPARPPSPPPTEHAHP